MSADVNCLMGEMVADPANTDHDIDKLLLNLLHALVREQGGYVNAAKID